MTTAAITAAALKMSRQQKATLAEKLVASLGPEPRTWTDAELIREVESRQEQLRRGETKLVSLDAALRKLERRPKR